MPLGGVIFDWDGVVINSSSLHEKSWEILATELKLPLPENHFELGFGHILASKADSKCRVTCGKGNETDGDDANRYTNHVGINAIELDADLTSEMQVSPLSSVAVT